MANRVDKASAGSKGRRDRGHAGATLLYLYGITQRAIKAPTGGGVDGKSPVEPLECAGFVCWISRVDAKEYGDELQPHMENLDWLAAASVQHQKVVGAIHEQSTILPARFATVFLTEDSLDRHVQERSQELKKDFKRLAGTDEYGVKIFAVPHVAKVEAAAASGRDYLQRKSAMLRDRTPVTVTPEVQKFAARLREIASQVAEGGSITSGQRHMVWQGSLLLPRAHRKELESALGAFHKQYSERYRVECTGPWPPYSFIALKAHS